MNVAVEELEGDTCYTSELIDQGERYKMASYTSEDYLMDRANIHDLVTKMSLFLDLSRWSALETEVFAEVVLVDYTSMFGGEPKTFTGKEQVESWKGQIEASGAKKWQHVSSSLLIDIPQPGESVEVPKKAGAIGNVVAILQREVEGSKAVEVSNGGRYDLNLVKTSATGNPWRINVLKADLVWLNGSWEELAGKRV